MLPLRDSKPAGVFPLITVIIIALNAIVFFIELTNSDLEEFISQWALVPAFVNWGDSVTLVPFLTSQFLHAGWLHILSNMWFLWIFGDNVEEYFGKFVFPVVYLLSGFVGGFVQYLINPGSAIPMLGASGAVAGVLGAYFVFFPRHKIETFVPVFGMVSVVEIPASVMLFYWFFTQIFSGAGAVAVQAVGGVAWFAHIGGFVTGFVLAKIANKNGR